MRNKTENALYQLEKYVRYELDRNEQLDEFVMAHGTAFFIDERGATAHTKWLYVFLDRHKGIAENPMRFKKNTPALSSW